MRFTLSDTVGPALPTAGRGIPDTLRCPRNVRLTSTRHNRSPEALDDATILQTVPLTEARAWKPESVGKAVVRYAPVTPFDVMWLGCGDEGNEMMADDQDWDASGEVRWAYHRGRIATSAIVCNVNHHIVVWMIQVVRVGRHLQRNFKVSGVSFSLISV